jgi:toxin ParE1/3/4
MPKMATIKWTRGSTEDLRQIKQYIGHDAPDTAELFVKRLIASTHRLASFPLSGSVIKGFLRFEAREILHGNYRVIYRVDGDRVLILSVFHASRILDEDSISGMDDG